MKQKATSYCSYTLWLIGLMCVCVCVCGRLYSGVLMCVRHRLSLCVQCFFYHYIGKTMYQCSARLWFTQEKESDKPLHPLPVLTDSLSLSFYPPLPPHSCPFYPLHFFPSLPPPLVFLGCHCFVLFSSLILSVYFPFGLLISEELAMVMKVEQCVNAQTLLFWSTLAKLLSKCCTDENELSAYTRMYFIITYVLMSSISININITT